jgi:hypothetical protein
MRTHHWLSVCVLAIGALVAGVIVGSANVQAQSAPATPPAGGPPAAISYPVAELGNCADTSACRAYCDDSAHVTACLAFAEQHGLMSASEVVAAKKITSGKLQGPGGCTTKAACETYCDDMDHVTECVSYAEQQGVLPPEKLAEVKKVQAAIARGVKPPPCNGKTACDAYCSDPNNMQVCMTFSKEAGLMSPEEQANADKMLAALQKGVKPPACRGKTECDTYCQSPDHIEECMTFSKAAGFMSPEEQANSDKMIAAIRKGVKPPPCNGKEACDAYCQTHMDVCTNFSVAAGFMTPEEAAVAKKTGGKGPGGCTSKDACNTFCNKSENQQTCLDFGVANGMIPPEQEKQIGQSKQQFKETITHAPPDVMKCLNDTVGADKLATFASGSAMPSKDIGDQMRTCFETFKGSPQGGGQGDQNQVGPGGQSGPGPNGCKSPEECKTYCETHVEECKNFRPNGQGGPNSSSSPGNGGFQPGPGTMNPGGQMMPIQAGPGGCKGPEECKVYCASHEEECKNFQPAGGQQPNQQIMGSQGGQLQQQIRVGQCEGENCKGGPQPGQTSQPLQQGNELRPGMKLAPGTAPGGATPGTAPGTGPGTAPPTMMPQGTQQPQQTGAPRPGYVPPSGGTAPAPQPGASIFSVFAPLFGLQQ